MQTLTHLLCIGILFVLPEVLVGLASPHGGHTPWAMYAKSIIFIGAFYINYFYLIDRWANKRMAIGSVIAYNILIIAVALIAAYIFMPEAHHMHGMNENANHPMAAPSYSHEHARHISRVVGFLCRDLAMIVLTIALSVALKLSLHWRHFEQRQQALAAENREQELKQLKSQLNPHFLFNSLNTIYALIAISPDKAQEATHTLSRLLRYALYDSSGFVTIEQEIAFLHDYIRLMAIRIGNRPGLKINLNAGDYADARIPAMLCISLVENVFKHGNTGNDSDIFEIKLSTNNNTFSFHTVNRFNSDQHKDKASGIGLVNVRRRLGLIYGDNASLACQAVDDTYIVDMTIKLGSEIVPELLPTNINTSNTIPQ
jgi:hypothetical protein